MKLIYLYIFALLICGCGSTFKSKERAKKEMEEKLKAQSEELYKEIDNKLKNYQFQTKTIIENPKIPKQYDIWFSKDAQGNFECNIRYKTYFLLKLTEQNSLDSYLNHLDYNNSDNIFINITSLEFTEGYEQYEAQCKYFLNTHLALVNILTKEQYNNKTKFPKLLNYKELIGIVNKNAAQEVSHP